MSNYTMSPVVNGEKKQMIVKVGDTLPIGTEVDYEGAEVPNGWEQIDDKFTEIWSGSATSISNLDLTKYKYIEVLFKSNDNFFNSLKVKVPTTSTFSVRLALCNSYLSNDLSTATYIFFKYGLAIMTETGITIQSNAEIPINKTDSSIHWQGGSSTLLYITSILGYK